jgi:hypothetical protein
LPEQTTDHSPQSTSSQQDEEVSIRRSAMVQ